MCLLLLLLVHLLLLELFHRCVATCRSRCATICRDSLCLAGGGEGKPLALSHWRHLPDLLCLPTGRARWSSAVR